MANRRYRPKIEGLVSRQMMAADTGLDFDSAMFGHQDATQQENAKREAVLKVQAFGQMMGAPDKLVEKSIQEVSAAFNSGTPVAKVVTQVNLTLVVEGLQLPKESLQSGLTADELIQFTGTLTTIDASADEILQDPKTFELIAKQGGKQGVENIYKDSIGTQFGVPKSVWEKFTSTEMLKGISVAQLISDEGEAATNEKYWDEYAAVESGQASKEDFLSDWSGGDYTDSPFDDFYDGEAGGDASGGSGSADALDDDFAPPDGGAGTGESDWIDVEPSVYVQVVHTSDGGFDLRGVDDFGNEVSEHYAPDANGGFTSEYGGHSSEVPPEGTYSLTTDEDGVYTFSVSTDSDEDNSGSGSSDSDSSDDKDGDGDDGGDDDDDNSSDSDDSTSDENPKEDETPVPDAKDEPKHLLLWALINANSPAGMMVLQMIEAAVAEAQRFGGKVDPVDQQAATYTPLLIWALTNPDNPAGQAYLASIDASLDTQGAAGGTENNPSQTKITLWDLAGSKSNIDLMMTGGGLINPVEGSGGRTPWLLGGTLPIFGTGGGLLKGFGEQGGKDESSNDDVFALTQNFLFAFNLSGVESAISSFVLK